MRNTILSLIFLLICTGINAQTLLDESFDNGIPEGWTLYNDGNTTPYPNYGDAWVGITSTGNPLPCVGSISIFDPPAQADRWLVTPAVELPEEGEFTLTFDAMAFNAPAAADGFEVRLSTADAPAGREDFGVTLLSVNAATNSFITYAVSLGAFAGQRVRVAIVQNSYNKNVLLVDNVRISRLHAHAVHPLSVHLPSLLAMGDSATLQGTIQNRGTQPLTSYVLTYAIEGQEPLSDTIRGLYLPLNGTADFTASRALRFNNAGTYQVAIGVGCPNGVDSLPPATTSCTLGVYDPAQAVPRTSVLEMFTTSLCGNCPPAHERIDRALESHPDVVLLCHHSGYYTDVMTTEDDEALLWFYNAASTYAPGVMYDRTNFPAFGADPNSQGQYHPNTPVLDPWDEGLCMDIALAEPSFASVSIDEVAFDDATRQLTVRASGHLGIYLPQPHLSIYLVQDSITAYQTYPVNDTILHHHVYRLPINGSVWGEPIDTGDFAVSHTITLPERLGSVNLNLWRCRVLAFVGNRNAAVPNDNRIQNATLSNPISAPYHGASIAPSAPLQLELYPNPATTHIALQCNEPIRSVTLVNTLGQKVLCRQGMNTSELLLPLEGLAPGIYTAIVSTTSSSTTSRVSITQ